MNKRKIKYNFLNIAAIFSLAIFFLADRFLKYLAMGLDSSLEIISNIFFFSFTKNYFISFSLPFSGPVLNVFISVLVALLLVYIVFLAIYEKKRKIEIFLLIIIFLGALSNLIDRLSFGFVIDYLEIKGLSVFNLADTMIAISSFFFIAHSFRRVRKEERDIQGR